MYVKHCPFIIIHLDTHSKKNGGANARTKNTVARLNMYRDEGKPTRNRRGKIVKPAAFQSRATPGEVARVEPNRKWFGEHDINIFSFLTCVFSSVMFTFSLQFLSHQEIPMLLLKMTCKNSKAKWEK